jgi:hypothetical protein
MQLSRPQRWLTQLFRDGSVQWACVVFSVLVLITPPDGCPLLDCCPLHRLTDAPCPVCGMTRSGANLVRGDLARAVDYHPFGPIIVPLLGLLGVLALVPGERRERVAQALRPWALPLYSIYLFLLAGLVVFGVARWYRVWQGWQTFPAMWP